MGKKIIFLALLICLCFSNAFGQENSIDLKDKRITLQLKDKPLWLVFQHLMVKYDVPIGMVGSTLDNEHADYVFNTNLPYIKPNSRLADGNFDIKNHLLTIEVENTGLEIVMDRLVGQLKNYRWEITDGVVNIVPTKGFDERYEKLLSVNIKNFSFQQNSSIGQIRNDILDLPEVDTFLNEQKIFSTKWRAFAVTASRRLPVGMNFSNLTLKELLNKITKIKRGGWLLRKSYLYGTTEKEYIEIDI